MNKPRSSLVRIICRARPPLDHAFLILALFFVTDANTQSLEPSLGKALFERLWVSSPSSTQAADGLGPLYNARACSSCHQNAGRGQNHSTDTLSPALVLKLATHPVYGEQLQNRSVAQIPAEYHLHTRYETTAVPVNGGGTVQLKSPLYSLERMQYGPLGDTPYSARMAPGLNGVHWLDKIPQQDIVARQDPDDLDGDGISGKANHVIDAATGKLSIGRFGHKATIPTLTQQVQSAFSMDMGLSTPLYPAHWGDCTKAQIACQKALHGHSKQYDNLEVHQDMIDWIEAYLGTLSAPQPKNNAHAGKKVFHELGCQQCHTPEYNLAESNISPYTDLLLHDMGEGLADNKYGGSAEGREWRTAPLWGIGQRLSNQRQSNFLHDGRARTVLEAILWHGGEAKTQRDAVVQLKPDQRAVLIDFLEQL